MGFKKKLYRYRPLREPPVPAQTTKYRVEPMSCDPGDLERGVRQLLADKVSGNLVGLWLLVPELLRLGVWDLLQRWTNSDTRRVEPRLALQLVHESALCVTGVRHGRCLGQRGFELANGLPFLATDEAIHDVLAEHTVADCQQLQLALGKLRRASGHFRARTLAIDPHRVRSFSKRQMQKRRADEGRRPMKLAQMFFVLDTDTNQPICFTTGTSARTATTAAIEALGLAAEILDPEPGQALVLADCEHFTTTLLDHAKLQMPFDLLMPMPRRESVFKKLRALLSESFQPRWAGYAIAKHTYTPHQSQAGPYPMYVQRNGERPEEYWYKVFLSTSDRNEVEALAHEFPKRWHVEEFFNANQALGWDRAGTADLNVRYGQMTAALVAQAVIHQFRQRLGAPAQAWDAKHLAKSFFLGMEGDIRVKRDTIVVTYYNAPEADRLRAEYAQLPDRLRAERVDPRIPWLYGFQLDFRFR